MLGTIRRMKVHLAGLVSGHWCPPADEAWMGIRPLPWEMDGNGRLKRQMLDEIVRLAGRNWLATAGPAKARLRGRPTSVIVGEAGTAGRFRSLTRLTVGTKLRRRDSRNWLLSHRIEDPSGHAVAVIEAKVAVSGEAEWSVFPPYPVANEAGVGQ